MKTVVLVLDESGAKGYSTNPEATEGELGVMAGYLVPDEHIVTVSRELDGIRLQFLGNGKLHVTDLTPSDQALLRKALLDYFSSCSIFCIYEAIYVEGLHQHDSFLNRQLRSIHAAKRSSVKVSLKEQRELLHSELFLGVFGKALAFVLDQDIDEFHLRIITDNIDVPILKRFEDEARELLSACETTTTNITGFDTETETLAQGRISIDVLNKNENFDLSKITFSISCEDTSLTLAADVLANSIHHHLKSLQGSKPGISLNSKAAIEGYALEEIMYSTWDHVDSNYVSDALYMHPANAEPKET